MKESVIVIGGGASGLTAAYTAASQGASVMLLERLPRVGKKILLTGNGRCNLGNADIDFSHYHGSVPQAEPILRNFNTAAFFRGMGVLTRQDAEGRLYPASSMAASVLDALRFAAAASGVQTHCEVQVTRLARHRGGWQVTCGTQHISADRVILAAGGSAAPNCGTDGNLFPVLRQMGYTVIKPQPALCPVPTDAGRVRALKGMRVKASASLLSGKRVIRQTRGEVQFTEHALSGICIFDLARDAARCGTRAEISLNLLPEYSEEEAAALLAELLQIRGGLPSGDLLTGILPKRIAETVIKSAGGAVNAPAETAFASETARQRLVRTLQDWRFPVTGTAPFSGAQVTAGGVSGECVHENLESRLHKGLYFCGEILDIDADCGGYNLMWAWSSGAAAAKRDCT